MKELTKAEEQIMHILWRLKNAVVKDIIEELPYPKPAYNTVSTIVRILENKEIVAHKAVGKTHIYYPILSLEEYKASQTNGLLKRFFSGNPQKLLSYFIEQEKMDIRELDEILKELKKSNS